MIYIIIFAIIGFVIVYDSALDLADYLIGAAKGALLGLFASLFIGGIIGVFLPTVEVTETQEIYALNDSSSIQGEYYLFNGYVDEKLTYLYVIDTEKGKQIKELDADNVYIKEGDYSPCIVFHTMKFENDLTYWFANYFLLEKENYVEIYVPQNTITTKYIIDLN